MAALAGSLALAQDAGTDVFTKAPPDVDAALRAQVDKFYQAHVDGKFRVAESCVCEESKDFFYQMEKQKYIGQELLKINYEENFTKATVVVGIEVDWKSPRLGTMRVKPPMNSLWKVENGQWCWYVKMDKQWKTPFGTMSPGPESTQITDVFKVDPKTIMNSVRLDRRAVELKSDQTSTAVFQVENSMSGNVSYEVKLPPVKGLSVKTNTGTLKKGERARVELVYEPPDKQPKEAQIVKVVVSPTSQNLSLKVTFALPAEFEKNVPENLKEQITKQSKTAK
jgi:hypothetical protein